MRALLRTAYASAFVACLALVGCTQDAQSSNALMDASPARHAVSDGAAWDDAGTDDGVPVNATDGGTDESPVVSAGAGQTIVLPTSQATLTGSVHVSAGASVASVAWSKTSGPTCTLSAPDQAQTVVTGLSAGMYVFELTATDDHGHFGTASTTVKVEAAAPPQVYATSGAGVMTLRPLGSTASQYGYVEYLPQGYDPNGTKLWPLLVFYHGAGEVGNGTSQLALIENHGPLQMINLGTLYPAAIVVAPQTTTSYWNVDAAAQFFQFAAAKYKADPKRIYLTGISLGGGITWGIGGYLPAVTALIAAELPISGNNAPGTAYYNPKIANTATLPTWAFVDYDDTTVVPTTYSDLFYTAYATYNSSTDTVRQTYPGTGAINTLHFDPATKKLVWVGGLGCRDSSGAPYPRQFLYKIYPNGGHDAWDKTYANPVVWEWLFSQHK